MSAGTPVAPDRERAVRGLATSSHFGGGAAAIPPPPVQPRKVGPLVLFCLLATACVAMTAIAASRFVLVRPHGTDAGGPASPVLTWVPPAGSQPAGSQPDGTGPDTAGPETAGPDGAGEWPTITLPVYRDAVTREGRVTTEQQDPGQGDRE